MRHLQNLLGKFLYLLWKLGAFESQKNICPRYGAIQELKVQKGGEEDQGPPLEKKYVYFSVKHSN